MIKYSYSSFIISFLLLLSSCGGIKKECFPYPSSPDGIATNARLIFSEVCLLGNFGFLVAPHIPSNNYNPSTSSPTHVLNRETGDIVFLGAKLMSIAQNIGSSFVLKEESVITSSDSNGVVHPLTFSSTGNPIGEREIFGIEKVGGEYQKCFVRLYQANKPLSALLARIGRIAAGVDLEQDHSICPEVLYAVCVKVRAIGEAIAAGKVSSQIGGKIVESRGSLESDYESFVDQVLMSTPASDQIPSPKNSLQKQNGREDIRFTRITVESLLSSSKLPQDPSSTFAVNSVSTTDGGNESSPAKETEKKMPNVDYSEIPILSPSSQSGAKSSIVTNGFSDSQKRKTAVKRVAAPEQRKAGNKKVKLIAADCHQKAAFVSGENDIRAPKLVSSSQFRLVPIQLDLHLDHRWTIVNSSIASTSPIIHERLDEIRIWSIANGSFKLVLTPSGSIKIIDQDDNLMGEFRFVGEEKLYCNVYRNYSSVLSVFKFSPLSAAPDCDSLELNPISFRHGDRICFVHHPGANRAQQIVAFEKWVKALSPGTSTVESSAQGHLPILSQEKSNCSFFCFTLQYQKHSSPSSSFSIAVMAIAGYNSGQYLQKLSPADSGYFHYYGILPRLPSHNHPPAIFDNVTVMGSGMHGFGINSIVIQDYSLQWSPNSLMVIRRGGAKAKLSASFEHNGRLVTISTRPSSRAIAIFCPDDANEGMIMLEGSFQKELKGGLYCFALGKRDAAVALLKTVKSVWDMGRIYMPTAWPPLQPFPSDVSLVCSQLKVPLAHKVI